MQQNKKIVKKNECELFIIIEHEQLLQTFKTSNYKTNGSFKNN